MVAEQGDDLIAFAFAHDPGIDEHTGQLVADGFMQQRRDHRRIDSARQPADDPAFAHLPADLGDFVILERRHRPVANAPGDGVGEIG